MKGQSSSLPFSCTQTSKLTSWGRGGDYWGEIQRTIWFPKSQNHLQAAAYRTQVLPWESQPGHFHRCFMHPLSSRFVFHITTKTAMLFTDCVYTINHGNVTVMVWYIPSPGLQAKWWMKKVHSHSWGKWLCFFHPVSTGLVGLVGNFSKYNFCAEM